MGNIKRKRPVWMGSRKKAIRKPQWIWFSCLDQQIWPYQKSLADFHRFSPPISTDFHPGDWPVWLPTFVWTAFSQPLLGAMGHLGSHWEAVMKSSFWNHQSNKGPKGPKGPRLLRILGCKMAQIIRSTCILCLFWLDGFKSLLFLD